MRKLGLIIIAVLSFTLSNAQTTIITDDSTYTPTSVNAIFEVHSSNGNKGILIPRLTTAQRTAISTSAVNDKSLLAFDTDTNTFWYFDGTQWVEIATGGTSSDDQLLTFSNDTLYIENGNWVYLGDYKELPQSAVSGQVLTWNGTAWVAQNPGSGADNWGTQVVVSDATLTGTGIIGDTLRVNGDLTDDQQLSFSGTTLSLTDGGNVDLSSLQDGTGTDDQNISGSGLSGTTLTIGIENGSNETVDLSSLLGTDDQNLTGANLSGNTLQIDIENGTSTTVDLSQFMDNTDNQSLSISGHTISLTNGGSVTVPDNDTQDLSLSGNTLSLTDGGSVDLSTITSNNSWNITGNSGTSSSNFIGTIDNVALNFRINNIKSGKIATNNTFLGYQAGVNATGTKNAFFGDGAGSSNTTGTENVFIGHNVGFYLQSGSSNTAIGYNALYNYGGAGFGPYAGGSGNVAVGKWAMFNPTSGDYNVAVGFSAFSLPNTGSQNVFIGYHSDRDNSSSVNYATAVGSYASADADYATAIGYKAYASQANSLILGQTTNDGNPNSATGNTNVGINTITPETGANLSLGAMDASNEGAQITWYGAGSHDTWRTDVNVNDFRIFSYSSNNNALRVFNAGSGVTDLIVDGGTGYATGGWQTTSDKRIKDNVKDLHYGLSEIMELKPSEYDKRMVKELKNGQFKFTGTVHSIGFIAQDVYKVIPYIVHKPKDEQNELWSIDYSKLTPVLVKAIQELKQQNDEQQKLIDKLIKQNEKLINRMNNGN